MSSPVLLIKLFCLFPFALPCFAPTAVPQVLQLPSGLTLSSTGSSLRPFTLRFPFSPRFRFPSTFRLPFPFCFHPASFPQLSFRFAPVRLGLRYLVSVSSFPCFKLPPHSGFHSAVPLSVSPCFLRFPSCVPPSASCLRFLQLSASAPHFFSPLGSLPWFVFLLCSPSRCPLSVSLVRLTPDLVLGSAALPFTAPGFASQLLLPFAFPPSQVWAFPFASCFPFVSSGSAFRPLRSGRFLPLLRFLRLRFGLLGAQIHPEN